MNGPLLRVGDLTVTPPFVEKFDVLLGRKRLGIALAPEVAQLPLVGLLPDSYVMAARVRRPLFDLDEARRSHVI